jgi:hypothetical protein
LDLSDEIGGMMSTSYEDCHEEPNSVANCLQVPNLDRVMLPGKHNCSAISFLF